MWQAVLFQDTFLTIILKLPPTATHTDVRVEDLGLEVEDSLTESGATGKHSPLLFSAFQHPHWSHLREANELASFFERLLSF